MMPPPVRVRRVEDVRRWFGRKAQYEIEHTDPDGTAHTTVTTTPGVVLRPLIGSGHPADLHDWTRAADLGWEGRGIGRWTRGPWPDDQTERRPVDDGSPVDPAAVTRHAARIVAGYPTDSLAGTLPALAAALERCGASSISDEVAGIARDIVAATSAEDRDSVLGHLTALWESPRIRDVSLPDGTSTEQAVCRLLIDRVADLLRRGSH